MVVHYGETRAEVTHSFAKATESRQPARGLAALQPEVYELSGGLGPEYQSGSWILLNGLGCSQLVRYRTPNRRASDLPFRRFEAQ